MARPTTSPDEILIELFLDMLAAERGAGENTLGAYRRDLNDLAAHLQGTGATVVSAETDDLRDYLADLDARKFKASSLARRLPAMRQLYRFLYAEGYRPDDPAATIEGPRRGRPLPKVLSIAEVDRLLATARAAAERTDAAPLQRL